ncbi:MAG: hypothetical protein IKZ53_00165 [Selenomonadaceae bacterium]|nr:hypothetical protein [Selenomonadaceae bacterium]
MKKNLFQTLQAALTEEELKNFFAKYFHIKLSTKNFIDLYTPQILFEFKLDSNLHNNQILAKIVAQTLYYVRRLKFGSDFRPVSQNIAIVTKSAAVIFPTETFATFYDDDNFDWDLAPSSPCKLLVNALANSDSIKSATIYDLDAYNVEIAFATNINNIFQGKSRVVKQITEQNFEQIFLYWQKLFGDAVANGRKPSEYFITDIEQGKSEDLRNSVLFRMNNGERVEKFIKPDKYHAFWDLYDKIQTADAIIAIRRKMDRMTEENLRRRTGEFYTPLAFADKAFKYLCKTVGEWWKDDNFRLWDMAAGTGNLEFNFPPDILKRCYISTLINDDAAYCKSIFAEATVFQYDFLNDSADKLPEKLRADLANPNIKWIIYINPPYATANNKQLNNSSINKDGVSKTAIREQMTAENLKEVSRELFSQFIYRISKDFANRQAWLGIFSTPKYINSSNDQNLRDKVFSYKFERGFIFNSKAFQGCNGNFSVSFMIWNLAEHIQIESQEIFLDVYNKSVEKYAEKIFRPARSENFLNKWIYRPPAIKKFPPMSGALNIAEKNKDRRDRVAEGFLASITLKGNEFSNQTYVSILSAPYVSAGAMSITAENFEQAMIVHMVRRLPKADWLNDRDQFMKPAKELPREFIGDAVVWSLFASSNQTVSLREVEYAGAKYEIVNNFYPYLLTEVKSWLCTSPVVRMSIYRACEDRFAAKWLENHRKELSSESMAVINAGREIYKRFYAELEQLDVVRWKIENWDAGWYQIRMSLGASVDLTALSAKLLPQIYELGFLRDEVRYF